MQATLYQNTATCYHSKQTCALWDPTQESELSGWRAEIGGVSVSAPLGARGWQREKEKGRGKETGRGKSNNRTKRLWYLLLLSLLLLFFKQMWACFGCTPSRRDLLCPRYQQRLSSSGLLTMATLFMVWSWLMPIRREGSQLCSYIQKRPEEEIELKSRNRQNKQAVSPQKSNNIYIHIYIYNTYVYICILGFRLAVGHCP